MIYRTRFKANGEELVGRYVVPNRAMRPNLLFLHGAGEATKERAQPLAIRLLEQYGVASFAFDFSGHGESTGTLGSSSLAKRVVEAKASLADLDGAKPISICAFSMGAHVALRLLEERDVSALILFYPAIYSVRAERLRFDAGFSAAIREPESWRNATAADRLASFRGNLLIIIGANDDVIPIGVIRMLDERAIHAHKKEILTIPNAGHRLLDTLLSEPDLFEAVTAKIGDYIA